MADSDQKVVVNRNGIGFCGILFIILLLLKVGVVETVVVGWSWIWIFVPLWGPLAFVASFFLVAGIIILIGAAIFGIIEKFKG